MRLKHERARQGVWRRLGPLTLLGMLMGCDSLLEVELYSELTDDALESPKAATTLVNSSIAIFECAYSSLALQAMGHEDVWERLAGQAPNMQYAPSPGTGTCDDVEYGVGWYSYLHTARAQAEQTYARLMNEWTVADVPNRETLAATAALYVAASLGVLGELFCEMAVNGTQLMSPEETLLLGEDWIQTALAHIGNAGDFELPADISPSAQTMAHALRARLRWARGDYAGALQDAELVPDGFTAWTTRDVGPQRRNKVALASFILPYGGLLDVNDWWQGIQPNPVTGDPWPRPIPFTGYLDLGVLPDGRAVHPDGTPVRTTVDAGAEADTRVPHVFKQTVAGQPAFVQSKYTEEGDDIPLVSWREMLLIRAEAGGGATAVQLVNELRDFHGLPQVTYVDPTDAQAVRYMILEERRRELWLEGGRWWSTKIQNVDVVWFPRNEGAFPTLAYGLAGGVRMIMPDSEYDNNQNLTRADRATLCDPGERPVSF